MFLVSAINATINSLNTAVNALTNGFTAGMVAIELMTALAIGSIVSVFVVEKLVDRTNHNAAKPAQ